MTVQETALLFLLQEHLSEVHQSFVEPILVSTVSIYVMIITELMTSV